MRMRMGWRRALAAGMLLAAAAACRTSGIYVPSVQMQLAVQPAEVRAGDTVRLAVTVTNPRPDTVLLEFGQECQVIYMVLDHTGRSVGPEDDGASCIVPGGGRLVLAPGEAWRVHGAWQASPAGDDPLLPGAYTIGAALGGHYSTVRGKREYKMGAGAEPVRIRLLPAGG